MINRSCYNLETGVVLSSRRWSYDMLWFIFCYYKASCWSSYKKMVTLLYLIQNNPKRKGRGKSACLTVNGKAYKKEIQDGQGLYIWFIDCIMVKHYWDFMTFLGWHWPGIWIYGPVVCMETKEWCSVSRNGLGKFQDAVTKDQLWHYEDAFSSARTRCGLFWTDAGRLETKSQELLKITWR